MCNNRGQSRFVNREPGCWGARVGKPGLIVGIWVISRMLRLFCNYVLAQAGRSILKAGPDIEEALDPVLVFIQWTTNRFEIVECRYFEHFGRTSKSARYAGWLSFRVQKVFAHILNLMRNLTESQYNRFTIGTERLNCEALVTTLARQFWTRCNLAISFSGILWKSELQ